MRSPSTLDGMNDHARELHERATIVVAHDHCSEPEDFDAMRRGGVTAKTLKPSADGVVWIREGEQTGSEDEWPAHANPVPTRVFCRRRFVRDLRGWTRWYDDALTALEKVADECGVTVIRKAADIRAAKKLGRQGVIIGSEGARHLEGRIENLGRFYNRGARELQLFWPMGNQLFDAQGLTAFGERTITECNRLGILIDVSHVGQVSAQAVLDVIRLSNAPVIVSHDAPKALGGGEMSDDLMRAVAGSGGGRGVFAIHFVTPEYIVNRENPKVPATVADLAAAIDYAVKTLGVEHVAIGGDFLHEPGLKLVLDIDRMAEVTSALVSRGYRDADIAAILGLNLIRLYEEVWEE